MTTEQIGKQLVSTLASVMPLYLSEAEADAYPYAVYEQTVKALRTKDGVYKYTSDTYIYIVGDDYSTVKGKADSIITTLETSMRTNQFVATLIDKQVSCDSEVWVITLNYTISQLY